MTIKCEYYQWLQVEDSLRCIKNNITRGPSATRDDLIGDFVTVLFNGFVDMSDLDSCTVSDWSWDND